MSLNKEDKEDKVNNENLNTEPLLTNEEKNNIDDNNNENNNIKSKSINNDNSSLNENIKIDQITSNKNNLKNNNSKNESINDDISNNEEEKDKLSDSNKNKYNLPRKTLNTPFMEKIMNKILSLDENEKINNNKKYHDDDFFFFGFSSKNSKKRKKRKENIDNSNSLINDESNSFNINTSLIKQKKKTIIKGILDLKKENEWSEFIEEYQKRNQDKKFSRKIKMLFNINSDFIVIWKFFFSVFYMVILYMFFFKFIFLEIPHIDENETPKKRILYLYRIINIMFLFDLILTIFIIVNNGGSLITFFKLPLKIYMVIPFPLKSKYLPYILIKFCRVDLFKRVFSSIEHFMIGNVTQYIQNYQFRYFVIYTNRMFAYLLEFGLYAHFTCCILSYLDDIRYLSSLYYTIETFTTIGFGENSPKSSNSIFIGIINLFIGINLFTIITCNVNYLTSKLYSFTRETSLKQQLEFLIFKMQNSTGKVFPSHLKQLISFFILFRRGLSYKDIKTQYEPVLKVCRNKIIKDIRKSLLSFLRKEYYLCFSKCEKQFINSLLSVLKPKIYKTNKIIVNYGQKVKYLYFLINGVLFAYNKNGKPVFTIFNSAIFCEYEFITGITSDFMIRVHPKIPAYGFVINKEDWENIAQKDIYSAEIFIKLAYEKWKRHLEWLDESYKNDNIIFQNIDNNKIEDINDIINEDNNNINNKKNLKNNNSNKLIPVRYKNKNYDFDNLEIIKNINNFNKEIQFLELSLIEYKQKIFNFVSH